MRFLIIGHLCHDVIHPVEGPEVRSYGGIYYSVATMASLLSESDRVVPVFGVNAYDYEPLIENLSQFSNVETRGIFTFSEPTNSVHLFYKDSATRIECSKNISQPIPFAHIKDYLDVDGILINMISGFDITLTTLDEIRLAVRELRIPIHFDYHSLTLGVRDNHERFRRPVSDWRRWAFMIDTVQLNEEELAGLTIEKLSEEQAAGHFLTLAIKGLIVTRGERGATVYFNDHKTMVRKDIPAREVERSPDSTGCGDVFGAAFHLHYVRTRDLVASAEFAGTVAAAKAQMAGAAHLHTLRRFALAPETRS
ncbi:MAG TPA: carbohydrate kinase family protein [Bacteroidota bacterium]|nr:carbohydrate kinase family protein [Bacteroidota bacterium]